MWIKKRDNHKVKSTSFKCKVQKINEKVTTKSMDNDKSEINHE